MTAYPRTGANDAPRTLLALGGTPPLPASLSEAVLVLIDAQNEYVSGKLPLTGITEAVAEAGRLLAAARASGTPVIHIVHHSAPGGQVFDPQTAYAEIIPDLSPLHAEEVIVKRFPNAFAGTPLAERLSAIAAATGRRKILLVGFMTHMCVSATARAALDHGIPATILAPATATRDLPSPFGGVIPAAVVQETALAELADRFAAVARETEAILAPAPRS